MSTSATVPVFDPSGVLRDVPQEHLVDAVKSGGMPAVKFQAPDKSIRFVPANRMVEAAHAGGTVVPIEDQDIKHPGFWSALVDDVKGMAAALPGMASQLPSGDPRIMAAQAKERADQISAIAQNSEKEKQAGYSTPYRVAAVPAQVLGVNVPGMEQSAAQGDSGGVLGHAAAVPAVMAATAGLSKGGPVADVIADRGAATVRAGARGANAVLQRAPGTIGGAAGAAVGGAVGGHLGAEIGGGAGALMGKEILPQVRIPGEGFGLPNRVEGGPANAPPYVPPSPETAPVANSEPAAASATQAPVENFPRTMSGESALRQILTGQDNANLLKIAKSRGINVTQEAQLKPGVADKLLVNKIIDNFSDDELDEVRGQYLENTRMGKHNFGEIGPEAWKTLGLKTYFPDVKIPAATLKRTAAAINSPVAPTDDLTSTLQESLRQIQAKKAAANQ